MISAVFFDLDGTLTDPKPGIVRSIRYAMDRLGFASPLGDDLTWCIGPPLQQSFDQLVGSDRAAKAVDYYRDRFSEIGWRENERYPGITDVLQTLTDRGLPLYVATSKPAVFADQIIDHFELRQFFTRVFGAELDGTRADKGSLLRHAVEEIGVGENAVMVGDRKHDIAGARANQLKSIGVTYGYGSRDELQDAGADKIVDKPEDLLSAIPWPA